MIPLKPARIESDGVDWYTDRISFDVAEVEAEDDQTGCLRVVDDCEDSWLVEPQIGRFVGGTVRVPVQELPLELVDVHPMIMRLDGDTLRGVPGTPMAEAMKAVVGALAPSLKKAGFRKRRHSFNRGVADGMVHVVSFQMGPYDPPGTEEIPGLRPNLYGLFAVNLGVYVPEMGDEPKRERSWVNEYDCHLRKRLGEFVTPGAREVWWSLDEPEAAAADVEGALTEHGLPWLGGLSSRQSVLDRFYLIGWEALGMAPRARIDIARLHLAMGSEAAADRELTLHWNDELAPSHREYFVRVLKELGRTHIVDGDETGRDLIR